MPITKIPVVNKFGIISEKQRIEITERLCCRKAVFNNSVVQQSFLAHKNPLEVTEEFVQHYNVAASEAEQQRYQGLALKMLARIKRRVGLNSFGIGKHVNIPVAWTELAQLIECRGTIHDECLNCLLLSLSQAPLHQNQVESLFFLAESLLFLLRTESLRQPFLRSTEIKLLKVCQLLFSRLYFHKMANHLHGCEDFKNKLSCYLQGLSDCQSLYSSYPDAHLALRFIVQVASIILANTELDINDKTNERDTHTFLQNKKKDVTENLKPCISSRESFTTSDARCPSGHTSWMSSSIHDLSPALWHSLDVWKCQNLVAFSRIPDKAKSQNSFNESIRSLLQCSSSPDNDSCWIDCVVAVTILAEGAKMNLTLLKVLQNLACHCINRTYSMGESQVKPPRQSAGSDGWQKKSSSATNKENRKQHKTQFNVLKPEEMQVDKDVTERLSGETLSNEGDTLSLPTGKTLIKREMLKTSPTRMSSFSNISSDAIIFNHYTNVESNFYHWHWDVAFTYTTLLGDIVLYAKTSLIQKRALLGTNKDITSKSFLAERHQCHQKSVNLEAIGNDNDGHGCFVGLLDLTFFQCSWNSPVEEENNWSWKIRFGAIQTLIRICESLAKDCGKEGLQSAAWGILYQANATEQDPRVLEALRVGYVQSNLDVFTKSQTFQFPCTLASYLANGLVKIYLTVPCYKHRAKGKNIVIKGDATNKEIGIEMQRTKKERGFKKHRTSLREEILFRSTWHVTPMNYNTRTTFHLQCLVEDQWRKDMIRETVKEENCLEGEKTKKVCWSFWGCHENVESLSKEHLHSTLKCADKNEAKVFQSEQEAKRQLKGNEISQKRKESEEEIVCRNF